MNAKLIEALEALVNKLEAIHNDKRYESVWTNYYIHGNKYTGPTYTEELEQAKAALAKSLPERVGLDEQSLFQECSDVANGAQGCWNKMMLAERIEQLVKQWCAPAKPEGGMEWPEKRLEHTDDYKQGGNYSHTKDGKRYYDIPYNIGYNDALEECKAKFNAPATGGEADAVTKELIARGKDVVDDFDDTQEVFVEPKVKEPDGA